MANELKFRVTVERDETGMFVVESQIPIYWYAESNNTTSRTNA